MDFHNMKRKELQALCKKHKIAANLSNLEMAKRLTEIFKEKESSSIQGLVNGHDENASETESTNMVMNMKVKKVRFSPEHELIEFTKSPETKRRTRRNSISVRNNSSSVENVDSGEVKSENVDRQSRVTRSRGSKLMEEQVNVKKRGRNGLKCHTQINNVSTIENRDSSELTEGNVDGTSRVLRSRGEKLVEGVKNARKRGKPKEDDKSDTKALDDAEDEKLIEKIVDSPGRLTRSRRKQSIEASEKKTKRVRRVVGIVANNVSLEIDDNRVATRRSSRNRERDLGERNNGKEGKEVFEKKGIVEVHPVIGPQVLSRRSQRNGNSVGDSQISNDTKKHENVGTRGLRKSVKLLAVDGSGVNAESRISEGETDEKVLQIEEPIKLEVRRSNRKKEVIASHEKGKNGELKEETENTYQLKSSVPQSVIAGVMRRSRRKTTRLEAVASDEKNDNDTAAKDCEAEKHFRKKCPIEKGTSAVQKNTRRPRTVAPVSKSLEIIDEKKNEARKRKRDPISEGVGKTNNDPISIKQPVEESKNEKAVAIAEAQLSMSEAADITSNPGFSSDTRNKHFISDGGLMSGEMFHKEKQDVSIADSAVSADTKKLFNRNELANSEENTELKTDSADYEKQISACSIQDAGKIDSLEVDVHNIIEQNITDMDKNKFEAPLFNQIQNVSCIDAADNQILPKCLNVSGNEVFAETSSSADRVLLADREVIEAETDSCTQPGDVMADHIGEVETISVQEKLDSVESGEVNVISSSIASQHNDVDHMEASKCISDDNKEDRASEAGEVDASKSCERCIDSTDLKSALQLKEPSSGKLRSIEGDNKVEGDENYFQKDLVLELAKIEIGESLKDHKSTNDEGDEFSVADTFDGERSFRDGGKVSGEYSSVKSDEQGLDKESLAVSPITTCIERDLEADHTGKGEESCNDKSKGLEVAQTDEGGSRNCDKSKCHENREFVMSSILDVERRDDIDKEILSGENSITSFDEKGMKIESRDEHEADQIAGDEANAHKDNQSQSAENSEDVCLKNHKNTENEDSEFSVFNLFDGEKSVGDIPQDRGVFSAEDTKKDFNEQVVFDDYPAVSTMCNKVKISAGSSSVKEISPSELNGSPRSQGTGDIISDACEINDNEAGGATIPEKEVAIVQNNIPGGEMSMNKNIIDKDHEVLNPTDEHTNEYTPKQAEQPESPSAIITAITSTLGASETIGPAKCMSQTNVKGITSPIVEGSGASEDGNDGNCAKDKDEFADACITDVDMSMDFAVSKLGAENVRELEFHHSEDIEYQSKNLHEEHTESGVCEKPDDVEFSQSWTEIELSNLYETTTHNVTPTGLSDTIAQGTEIGNLILCVDKSDANSGNSLTNKKEQEMEGERGSEAAKTTYKNAFSPTGYKEVSDYDHGSGVEREDNQFKLLFATPIKIDSPTKVDETSSHEDKLERADVSIAECVGATKTNAVAQIKSDGKLRVAESELENSLCSGSSSSDNSEEINNEELNEVESVELVNASTTFFSETSKEPLTENTCECLQKSDFLTEENREEMIISLGESCLHEEARDKDGELTGKNTISSSGSMMNLGKLEDCQDMSIDSDLSENLGCGNSLCLKSEKKVAQSSEATLELSDADIEKFNVFENSHNPSACYGDSNLSETVIDTFKDAEMDNIGNFNGTSPCLFSKASDGNNEVTERKDETIYDDDNPYEAQMWDEKDDNSRSFRDIPDEPYCTNEVENLRSPSVGNTLELQSPFKGISTTAQNVDNMLPAAEKGLSVCGAEFDVFSSLGMHFVPGDNENNGSEKSEVWPPVCNLESDHEKNHKEVEKKSTSTATKVRFSISEFHSEQKFPDSNNDVHSISDEVTDNDNVDIEKSDVETPLLNLEGGNHEKNDKEMEENLAGTIVQFPISELCLEENFIDSKNDVIAFGCNEFLKESGVADTIDEYTDAELACINKTTSCEDGVQSVESLGMGSEHLEEPICVDMHVGGDTSVKTSSSSVETKGEEQIEKMLFKESLTGPKTGHSPTCVALFENSGTSPSPFGNDEATERKDQMVDGDDDPYEAQTWDEKDDISGSFRDIPDELYCHNEMAISRSPSVGNTLELQGTCKGISTIAQNVDNMLPAAEQGLSVCGAEFDVFSSLEMHLIPGYNENDDSEKLEAGTLLCNSECDHEKNCKEIEGKSTSTATEVQFSISYFHSEQSVDVHSVSDEVMDNENVDIEKWDVGASLFNLEGGDHEKTDKEVEENLTAAIVQFPISELRLEENLLDSKNDVTAFGCNELLEESGVADTIDEYTDAELACINKTTTCEDGLQSVESLGTERKDLEGPLCADLHVEGDTADKSSSVETKGEEQMEEMLFKESLTGPKSVHYPTCVDLFENSEKEETKSDDGSRSSSRQSFSTTKKDARTILIHGTPSKVMTMADMKENAPTQKGSNVADFTAVRPPKRKALQDVHWK